MSYKIFINDTALYIVNIYDADELKKLNGEIVSSATKDIRDVIREIEDNSLAPAYFYLSDNPHASWNILLSYYSLIEAAGGVVINDKQQYLVIFRRGKWDLPKGKMEYDETPEQAALREVEEECGITGLTITAPLPITFHTYSLKRKSILKKTHWFLMDYKGTETPMPQTEEDIEKVEWMTAKQINTIFFSNTYNSIREFLKSAIKNL